MVSVRKRGLVYWLEARPAGVRTQVSLGTRNHDNAIYARAIERALVEGTRSEEWPRLRNLLPVSTFESWVPWLDT